MNDKDKPIYRIAKWNEVFETAESRRHKVLSWVSMPLGFNSHGYQSLVDDFGDDAPAIFGAWCALVALAATMPIRGVLCSSRGIPLSINAIARQTFFPVEVFRRLIEWASKPEISWIIVDSAQQFSPEKTPPSRLPADHQANTGLQDKTQQDQTKPNNTRQTQPSGDALAVSQTVVGRRSSNFEFDFAWGKSELDREGKRFRRVSLCSQAILPSPDLAWLLGFGLTVGPEFLHDLAQTMRDREIKRPKKYCRAAATKFCQERGLDFVFLDQSVSDMLSKLKIGSNEEVKR